MVTLASDSRFATNSDRSANRCKLRELIHTAFADLTVGQTIERLDAAGTANARVNNMAGVWNRPQLAARDRWQTIDSPAGNLYRPCCHRAANRGFEARMDPVPDLGEYTETILAALYYDNDAIARLRRAGAV
jgi:itaconate CoA-transferase